MVNIVIVLIVLFVKLKGAHDNAKLKLGSMYFLLFFIEIFKCIGGYVKIATKLYHVSHLKTTLIYNSFVVVVAHDTKY
jgi:hypothetical protein